MTVNHCCLHTEESVAQSICLSCALCCDGSIFRRAKVFNEESRSFFENIGLKLQPLHDGKHAFSLPCHCLSETYCSIYGKKRPRICVEFRCKLLLNYFEGKIDYDSAIKTVGAAVKHVRDVRHAISKYIPKRTASLADLYTEWTKKCNSNDEEIKLSYQALQFRFDRDFRVKTCK